MKFALMWLMLAATTAVVAAPPFGVGEKLTYEIRWGPLVAGQATLTVTGLEPLDGQVCYHLVGAAQTTGFVDLLYHVDSKIESWLDATGFFTHRFSQNRREGKSYHAEDSRYDYAAGQITTTNLINGGLKTTTVTGHEQDLLSAFYFLRTQPLQLNHDNHFPVDLTGKHYDVAACPDQRKILYFRPTGDIMALRIEPNPTLNIVAATGGKMWFWVSDDARKLPLMMVAKMKFGSIRLVLAGIEPTTLPKPTLAQR